MADLHDRRSGLRRSVLDQEWEYGSYRDLRPERRSHWFRDCPLLGDIENLSGVAQCSFRQVSQDLLHGSPEWRMKRKKKAAEPGATDNPDGA